MVLARGTTLLGFLCMCFAGCDPGDPQTSDSVREVHNPNQLNQDELFTCNGELASTPARLRRIDNTEYARSTVSSNGLTVPLLPGIDDQYSTYTSDETLDTSILREYLRQNHTPADSWYITNNNGGRRLRISRGVDSIKDQVACFQIKQEEPYAVVYEEPDADCVRSFVTALLEYGVYFRPATEEEVERLFLFAQQQLEKERTQPDVNRFDTIETIVRAAWMTYSALFHTEIGAGETLPDGRRKLSDGELAKTLSLALSDHVAGAPQPGYINEEGDYNRYYLDMYQAAGEGGLSDPDTLEALVRKYISGNDPFAGDVDETVSPTTFAPEYDEYLDGFWMSGKMRGFFQEWLGYANVAENFKDTPEATSRFHGGALFRSYYDEGGAGGAVNDSTFQSRDRGSQDSSYNHADLAEHLDTTIARIVATDEEVLKNLLTSRQFFVKQTGKYVDSEWVDNLYTNTLYNINILETGTIQWLDDQWVTLPADERAGVLTHPAWLAAHGGNFENDESIIYRGKWVRENLLCDHLPNLPLNVNAMLDPDTADLSARVRVSRATDEDPYCASCHDMMNPLGYPFEIYNHAGFVRADDHGAPPSGLSTLKMMPDDPVLKEGMVVTDAIDMMAHFSDSRRVKRCFMRQSFRYFVGRDETRNDACSLVSMEQAYDASGGSMTAMLVALFQSDSFLLRHDEEGVP